MSHWLKLLAINMTAPINVCIHLVIAVARAQLPYNFPMHFKSAIESHITSLSIDSFRDVRYEKTIQG